MKPTILAGTADGLHELNDHSRIHISGHEVRSLARADSAWWAVIDDKEVWRSDAQGEWTRVAAVETLRANCVLPMPTGTFVGTSEAHVHQLRGEALEPVLPFDETRGHEDWYTPWRGPPDVRSMSAGPSGTVYANVHVGGVVRTKDGGATWEPTIDIHADVHQVLFDPGSAQVLAASARGLAISKDEGQSWRFDTEGLHGSYLRAVAVADGAVLVTASTGPFTNRAAVYRKPLHSQGPFERCQHGLPESFPQNIDTYCLAASGANVAFGTSEGQVYLSLDDGETWEVAADGLPPILSVALA